MTGYILSLASRCPVIGGWVDSAPLGAAALYGLFAAGIILGVVSVYVMVATYAERKIAGFIQSRLGPMEVGPQVEVSAAGRRILPRGWFGVLQPMADGIKVLAKEDHIPEGADDFLFRFAPYIVFGASFTAFAAVPFAPLAEAAPLNIGILFILAASSVSMLGILIGGYASNNKYSLYGGMRSASQFISYEVPLTVALLAGFLDPGSLRLSDLVSSQGGGVQNWAAFRDLFLFIAFVVYYIAALAETNRTPFDLPEAESELVAGFHTEYSGMRFSLFFMAEYANMLLVSMIAVLVFLGGWDLGIPYLTTPLLLAPFVLLAKAGILVLGMIWIRWTVPRFRVDRLMEIAWKGLLPLALVALIGTGFAVLFPWVRFMGKILLIAGLCLFVYEVAAGLKPFPMRRGSS